MTASGARPTKARRRVQRVGTGQGYGARLWAAVWAGPSFGTGACYELATGATDAALSAWCCPAPLAPLGLTATAVTACCQFVFHRPGLPAGFYSTADKHLLTVDDPPAAVTTARRLQALYEAVETPEALRARRESGVRRGYPRRNRRLAGGKSGKSGGGGVCTGDVFCSDVGGTFDGTGSVYVFVDMYDRYDYMSCDWIAADITTANGYTLPGDCESAGTSHQAECCGVGLDLPPPAPMYDPCDTGSCPMASRGDGHCDACHP